MKNINSKVNGMGQNKDALLNFYMPLETRVDSRKIIKDVERFRSLTTNVVMPNDCLPHTWKITRWFFLKFIGKFHELQSSKHTSSAKTSWDTNFRMRFFRWKQTNDLITNEAKKFTRHHENANQIISAPRKLDADRLLLSESSSKPNMHLSACMTHVKSTSTTYQNRISNQHEPKSRKSTKLKDLNNYQEDNNGMQ